MRRCSEQWCEKEGGSLCRRYLNQYEILRMNTQKRKLSESDQFGEVGTLFSVNHGAFASGTKGSLWVIHPNNCWDGWSVMLTCYSILLGILNRLQSLAGRCRQMPGDSVYCRSIVEIVRRTQLMWRNISAAGL